MSDTLSAMSTKQYRPSRRSWVKLWVNEWLTGTIRWQLTPQQRSMWADLLALAGNSRYPGIVCSGDTNGVLDPFPIDYLCSVFRCPESDVQAAFDLFIAQGRIVINEAGVIRIVNWDKYQSEYQLKRQRRTYKEARRPDGESNVRRKSKKTPPEEVEEEVDVEGEVEVEDTTAAFSAIGFAKPFGHKPFKDVWLSIWAGRVGNQWITELMEQTIQTCQTHNIKVPPQFYEAKHDVEKRENATVVQRAPL